MSTVDEIIATRTPKPRFPILDVMKKRFSPRVFSSESIPNETMQIILEAARFAPSARNCQPWSFYWTRKGTKSYENLLSCIPERNGWAASAPVLIVACYDSVEQKNENNPWVFYDLGEAVISLILQAQELGIYSRQIGIFDISKAKNSLQIPDPYNPLIIIAMGKLGTEEDYKQANPELIVKDLSEVIKKENIAKELT